MARDHRGNGYDTAQVCPNGHVATSHFHDHPGERQDFCQRCGEKTLHACPKCDTEIRGQMFDTYGFFDSPPAFCIGCGAPFPWTQTHLETARTLIEEAEHLAPEDRTKLQAALPDLIADTPKTPLAIERFKRLSLKAGAGVGGALRDVLVDVVSESVRKVIWPDR
jgi:hypothetical protein